MKYMVKIEQNPDYWKDHYRAVAYEMREGEWHPIRIIGEGSQDDAEWFATGLRTRYGLEGHIIITRGPATTVVHGHDNNSMLYWLFENEDNKIVEWWLRRNEYQLVERSQDVIDHPETHYLCGIYRKV